MPEIRETNMPEIKPMNYGHANAIMILVAEKMGLNPPFVDEAKNHLQGGSIQITMAKAMEDAAVRANDQMRHDVSLIDQANGFVNEIKSEYGFTVAPTTPKQRPR